MCVFFFFSKNLANNNFVKHFFSHILYLVNFQYYPSANKILQSFSVGLWTFSQSLISVSQRKFLAISAGLSFSPELSLDSSNTEARFAFCGPELPGCPGSHSEGRISSFDTSHSQVPAPRPLCQPPTHSSGLLEVTLFPANQTTLVTFYMERKLP